MHKRDNLSGNCVLAHNSVVETGTVQGIVAQ